MITADVIALYLHLKKKPDDWVARMVLADALEDSGKEMLAHGQRWQGKEHKAPSTNYSIVWWDLSCYAPSYERPEPDETTGINFIRCWRAMLPTEVFALAYAKKEREKKMSRTYRSVREAEWCLARALWGLRK